MKILNEDLTKELTIEEIDFSKGQLNPHVINNEEILIYTLFNEQLMKEIQIKELKKRLNKYKEDVEQVELFGMVREDFEQKKAECKTIIETLRILESNG